MTPKILVAAALALGLGTGIAVAQTTPTQPEGAGETAANPQLPPQWDSAITDAFFADPQMGTLRSQDEVRSNWEALSDEQQAQVRSDCSTMDTAGTQTDDDMTTGSTTPGDATTTMAAVEQVCDWVGAM